jgi:hypothetical protein
MLLAGFERLNAMRMSIAGDGLTEPNLYFHSRGMKMQSNLLAAPPPKGRH